MQPSADSFRQSCKDPQYRRNHKRFSNMEHRNADFLPGSTVCQQAEKGLPDLRQSGKNNPVPLQKAPCLEHCADHHNPKAEGCQRVTPFSVHTQSA